MQFSEMLTTDRIYVNPNWAYTFNKFELIRELCQRICPLIPDNQCDCCEIENAVLEREKKQTTGIGEEVAMPHASLPCFQRPTSLLVILPRGYDFAAIDYKPVKFVILVLIPKGDTKLHLDTLACIARLFYNPDFRKQLSHAKTSQAAMQIIKQAEKESKI
ncbi:MAG: PTS sugar transporter subunit IIA [Candidatus Hydrogenedentota bacterium]|nr:MAG: PTS sugar transporter subunit IIA [Candidatus Hydrogenedentota bacterium]